VRTIEALLLVVGTACLCWFFFVKGNSAGHQAAESTSFQQLRTLPINPSIKPSTARPGAIVPRHQQLPEGTSLAQIEIPSLGLTAMVDEGVSTGTLRRAVGHIPGTAMPGQPGNVAVAAHRDTFFRRVGELKPDDLIVMDTVSGEYLYKVKSAKIVDPYDTAVLKDAAQPSLTLVTCYPFHYIGHAPKRYIVTAEQTGAAHPVESAGLPTAAAESAQLKTR
jgi:sortase A